MRTLILATFGATFIATSAFGFTVPTKPTTEATAIEVQTKKKKGSSCWTKCMASRASANYCSKRCPG